MLPVNLNSSNIFIDRLIMHTTDTAIITNSGRAIGIIARTRARVQDLIMTDLLAEFRIKFDLVT